MHKKNYNNVAFKDRWTNCNYHVGQPKKKKYMTENVGFSMFCLCQEQTYHLINSLLRSFRLLPVFMLS